MNSQLKKLVLVFSLILSLSGIVAGASSPPTCDSPGDFKARVMDSADGDLDFNSYDEITIQGCWKNNGDARLEQLKLHVAYQDTVQGIKYISYGGSEISLQYPSEREATASFGQCRTGGNSDSSFCSTHSVNLESISVNSGDGEFTMKVLEGKDPTNENNGNEVDVFLDIIGLSSDHSQIIASGGLSTDDKGISGTAMGWFCGQEVGDNRRGREIRDYWGDSGVGFSRGFLPCLSTNSYINDLTATVSAEESNSGGADSGGSNDGSGGSDDSSEDSNEGLDLSELSWIYQENPDIDFANIDLSDAQPVESGMTISSSSTTSSGSEESGSGTDGGSGSDGDGSGDQESSSNIQDEFSHLLVVYDPESDSITEWHKADSLSAFPNRYPPDSGVQNDFSGEWISVVIMEVIDRGEDPDHCQWKLKWTGNSWQKDWVFNTAYEIGAPEEGPYCQLIGKQSQWNIFTDFLQRNNLVWTGEKWGVESEN